MSNPRRWLDDPSNTPDVLRDALRGARADLPDAGHVDELARSIAAAIKAPPPTGSSGPADGGAGGTATGTASTSGASVATKLALGGVATIAVVGAVLATRGTPPSIEAPSPAASVVASATAAKVAPAASDEHASETVLDVHALPSVPGARPTDAGVRTSTSSSAPARSPDSEMAMLGRAQHALATSPAEALARCEEHAAAYPSGALAEEREVLAVDALLRLGRRADASARAERFRTAHPSSAYVRRLDTLLGEPGK
jgi:hypothetical protein